MEIWGLERAKINDMTYACSVQCTHMYQCINELSLYNLFNFALYYNYYKVSFKTLH
jgi:hypothetical protein